MKFKLKRTGCKALVAGLVALQVFALAAPASAAVNTGTNAAPVTFTPVAGVSSDDPGFVYGSKSTDYVSGQEYYYLENQYVKTLIGPTKAGNDKAGPFTSGAIMDAVSKDTNRENLDWTQFVLSPNMNASWNTGNNGFDISNLEVRGNTVVGTGASKNAPGITGEVTYSLEEDSPLIKMEIKLTNTGDSDYQGYFEYLMDPDESGEDDTYVPGVGWTKSQTNTVLTDHEWNENYIFEGTAGAYTGNTAHAILWDESVEAPAGLVNDGYIFGVWYDASLKAGDSKTITIYHLPHKPGDSSRPYAEAALWAADLRGDIDLNTYGVITGTITDIDGEPIQNVDITCQYATGDNAGTSAGTAVTDENGNYSMRVEKDVYTLTASIPGYDQGSQSIDMRAVADYTVDIELDTLSGTRILDSTSMQSFGGLVEGKPGDYTIENENLTMSVAKESQDGQLQASSAGRILDIAANGRTDVMDWLFTSWISDVKPHQTVLDKVNPGDSWMQLDTRFDDFEVLSQSSSRIVLKATGVYHHDLANTPDGQEAVIQQIITLESGRQYAEIETTIKNISGEELTVYAGDAMDVDKNTQNSYVPGIDNVTATYNSPIDEKPSQPWFAQFASAEPEIYAFMYDDAEEMRVFGSNQWMMGYIPVTLAADESYTYSRQLVVLDTEGYGDQSEAMNAFYNTYMYGLEANMEVYDGTVKKGDVFPVSVTVENSSDKDIKDVEVSLTLPYQMFNTGEKTKTIAEVPAGQSKTVEFSVLALEGGRGQIKAGVQTEDGISINFSEALSISGEGYYAGDNHTHSVHSDGQGTIHENVDSAYEDKLLNWLYSTDHNKISQYDDTVAETSRLAGNFINITGTEITSSNRGHALAYGIGNNFIPEYRIDQTINGQTWTWQDTIDQVNEAGGIFYVAHPNYPGLKFSDPYGIQDYQGIEVWNGFYHAIDPDKNVNTFAFDYWDDVNRRGEQKYFGIANSDGHNSGKMGDPYIKTEMDNLTYDNIQEILANGNYYGSNGPEIRYNIDGAGMGETLIIKEAGKADFNITAFDQNYDLVNVKLIKNEITGSADEGESEVVFNENLEGKGVKEFKTTLSLDVKAGEFYRVEVTSQQGTTGNGGQGQGQGLGFAFSNPIWIDDGERSNATDIKSISYDGGQVIDTIGGNTVISIKDDFSEKDLEVEVSEGATVDTEVIDSTDGELSTAAAVKITVTAEDGTQEQETVFLTQAADEETSAEIVSLEGVRVDTQVGKLPDLPAMVTAAYDDGTQKDVAVTWDEVTKDMVSEAGEFTIEGKVDGTSIKAEATINVVAAGTGGSDNPGNSADTGDKGDGGQNSDGEQTADDEKIPETGDNNMTGVYLALALGSAAAAGGIVIYRRRRSKDM